MQNFRELTIDIALSKRINGYERIYEDGLRRRNSCVYYNAEYCKKFSGKSKILASWKSNGKIVPHPAFCYLCPYYSIKDDGKIITADLLDIYIIYVNLKGQLEKELEFIENRLSEFSYSTSIALRRRREDLLAFLDDVISKIKMLLEMIRISEINGV